MAVEVLGIVLAPALVEEGVQNNARMIMKMRQGLLAVGQEEIPPPLRGRLVDGHQLAADGGDGGVPDVVVGAGVHEILEYQHAQPVAVVVKPLGFDLDVLAQGVEAQLLHGPDIKGIALGAAGQEQTVGPVALVQKAVEEGRLPVQADPGDALHDLSRNGAQGEVSFHSVCAISHNNCI